MAPGKPLDDDMFMNSNFLESGRYGGQELKPSMINPVSSASAVLQVVPQSTAQSKPQQPSPSEPQDSVHLSSKAQARSSGDVDHDGDSH
jgi:hypothetical protein